MVRNYGRSVDGRSIFEWRVVCYVEQRFIDMNEGDNCFFFFIVTALWNRYCKSYKKLHRYAKEDHLLIPT